MYIFYNITIKKQQKNINLNNVISVPSPADRSMTNDQ